MIEFEDLTSPLTAYPSMLGLTHEAARTLGRSGYPLIDVSTSPPDRFPYPRQLVVGMFGREQELERAIEALRHRGFDSDSGMS